MLTLILDIIDAWIPEKNDAYQFVEINLMDEMPIYGLDIAGSFDLYSYTTAISVLYSSDAIIYHSIEDNHGGAKVCFETILEIHDEQFLFRCLVQMWTETTESE